MQTLRRFNIRGVLIIHLLKKFQVVHRIFNFLLFYSQNMIVYVYMTSATEFSNTSEYVMFWKF